jgi:hypothetical protein
MASRDRARRLADLSAEALWRRRRRLRRIMVLWPALQYLAWTEEAGQCWPCIILTEYFCEIGDRFYEGFGTSPSAGTLRNA